MESRRVLATITVTTTADAEDANLDDGICEIAGGGCSLRAAVQQANRLGETAGPHVINLPAGVYELTIEGTDESLSRTGDLNLRTSMSVIGAGADRSVIDGGGIDRVLDVVLGNVLIQGVTIRGGAVGADNEAFEYIGGGIRNQASLTLTDSLVTGNVAGSGAGIANYGGSLTIKRSVITGNGDVTTTRGGGVFNYSNYDTSNLEIVESTITGNRATTGGGVLNFAYDGNANVLIERSTLAANTALSGAAIANRSTVIFEDAALANLSLRNSTVSGNTAAGSGGGVHSQSSYGGETQTEILNSTITGNVASGLDGGGVWSLDSASVMTVLRSTIAFGNTAGRDGNDLFGQSISGTFNLVGDPSGHPLTSGADKNLIALDPLLGPLADNGGPTQTHLPLDGSPVIDQGVNSLSLASDQRGSAFLRRVDYPAIGNASDGTDIGAVEVGQVAATFDYGDAPDGIDVGGQLRRYPTTAVNDGARHRVLSSGPFLGTVQPDSEPDGQTSQRASGDDLFGSDDEDGLPSGSIVLQPGEPISGVIISHNGAASGAFLNVWLDINLDGDWEDPGEHLVNDRSVPPGSHNTSLAAITLPSGSPTGLSFLRTRISTQPGLMPTGEAIDGEVEDYQVTIGAAPIEAADLSLRQIVDNTNPAKGETVTFTITITNDGPDRATNVEVTDVLPPELLFQQATVTQGVFEFEESWFLESLEAGESAELRIRATVDSSDSIQNTAEITQSDQFDPDSTPGNGISGEDDQATVTLGTCLSGGPLHAGMNRLTFSCASPGAWVGFVHGTQRGLKTFDQYNVTVDIADAEGVAISIADTEGVASMHIRLTEQELQELTDGTGEPLIVQAFEMLPRRFKSNTLVIDEQLVMLRARQEGSGSQSLEKDALQSVAKAVVQRWAQIPLPAALQERLENVRVVISDLPEKGLARVLGRTIIVDGDAAGNGWYLDPSPLDDLEFRPSIVGGRLDAADPVAAERIDLVTVLMHEYGHVLGLSHVNDGDHLMNDVLRIGVRRLPASDTNTANALDVNSDGRVTALDALQVINWIGRRRLSTGAEESFWLPRDLAETHFVDTNGDFRVSAADALRVINHLARRNAQLASGEWSLWNDSRDEERGSEEAIDAALRLWLEEISDVGRVLE